MSETTELHAAVKALTASIDQLRQDLVRKDVYAADRATLDVKLTSMAAELREIKSQANKNAEQRAADRRLIIAAFVAPVVLLLLQLYIQTQAGG